MGKSAERAGRAGFHRRRAVEVCTIDPAGVGGDLVSAGAFESRRDGDLIGRPRSWDVMAQRPGKMVLAATACLFVLLGTAGAQGGGELRFCLRTEPRTFDPLKVEDDAAVSIRYLTGGVLLRMNRQSQALEPELARSWKVSKDGRQITFTLRSGLSFSDGTPFSAEDVAYTLQQLMDAALHSPTGDAFRSGPGTVATKTISSTQIAITFPAPVAGLDRLFDQVPVMSAHSPKKEMAVLGPFMVADYKPGATVLLKRNPNYWKTDAQGRKLPYLDSIRLDIQPNRDVEMLRFRRGELDLINSLDSEYFDKLASTSPQLVHDAGPSLDSEQMWFNQVSSEPRAQAYGSDAALKLLQTEGFRLENGTLKDREGNPVVFSIVTNSGNKYRERMAVLIQEDLWKIGMQVNLVTLDFPSLIERIAQTFDYEAAMLGLTNVDLDPNEQMNVWLSSAENHQWNPQQKSPETAWEGEIDRLMRAQAASADAKKRKESFDRVQEIVVEQAPFIYLINKNALSAISTAVRDASPVILHPQTFWNAERLTVRAAR